MTTPARLAANRRNARKSTGPRTADGKAAAARNALRHGLTARQIACREEDEADFAGFHAALRESLDPADEVEEQLVERIVLTSWRLRRVARAERGLINDAPDAEVTEFADWISRAFDFSAHAMATLGRYEATLDRALGRAYALLERRQTLRRGEPVAAPVTVLVEGGASGADSAVPNPLDRQHKNENYETNPSAATVIGNAAG